MCHAIYIAGAKLAIKPLLAKYYTERKKKQRRRTVYGYSLAVSAYTGLNLHHAIS